MSYNNTHVNLWYHGRESFVTREEFIHDMSWPTLKYRLSYSGNGEEEADYTTGAEAQLRQRHSSGLAWVKCLSAQNKEVRQVRTKQQGKQLKRYLKCMYVSEVISNGPETLDVLGPCLCICLKTLFFKACGTSTS